MAGVISLNGQFSYPIEVLKTLTVDDKSTFKKSVTIGNGTAGANRIAFSFGDNTNADADYATAIGYGSRAKSKYSIAAGHETEVDEDSNAAMALGTSAKANRPYSFVWSGVQGSNKYTSLGDGTFCIRPNGGVDGVFVEDDSLPDIIKKYAIQYVQTNSNVFDSTNVFKDTVTIRGGIVVDGGEFTTDSGIVSKFNGDVQVPDVIQSDVSNFAANTRFVHENVNECVKLKGGTMVGDLILNREPEFDMQAATKKYVNEKIFDSLSDNISVNNSKRPNGTEIASIRVNNTSTKLYAPKVIAGQNTTVVNDEDNGTVKISLNSDISFVGGSIKVPVGTIVPFGGGNAPDGFMHCDGRELSRNEYSELYSVIGLTFTSGLNVNTFNIPKIDDGRILTGHSQNGTEKTITYDNSGTSTLKTFGIRYYIKYRTVSSDKPVLSVNNSIPDANGNVNIDVSFNPKSETWTFKKMNGEEYTRKVLIGD